MAEMLASPFGSHATRILSPRLSVFLALPRIYLPQPPHFTQQEIEPLDLSLDSPEGHAIPTLAPLNVEDITSSWNNRKWTAKTMTGEEDDEEDFILESPVVIRQYGTRNMDRHLCP
jgi:hypothetical protein